MIDTEVQAAEALEKFALSMSDVLNGAGDMAKYVGDTVSSAANSAGASIHQGWTDTPDPVRRSIVGASGGAAIMALVEALRAKKKKQYANRALIGGAIGAILPHMGDSAGLVTKLAFNLSDITDNPHLQAAAPALIGAGLGATGGALIGKKGRRFGTAVMGGLAGGALGAASPFISDAVTAYSGQRKSEADKQKALNTDRSWADWYNGKPKPKSPTGVIPNRDTMINHSIDMAGDAVNAATGSSIGAGALTGGVAGMIAQHGRDRIDQRTAADGRDFLNRHEGDRGKLTADILTHMKMNPQFMSGADIQAEIARNPGFADDLPKMTNTSQLDVAKAVEMLRKQKTEQMAADAHVAGHSIPGSQPKHTWLSLWSQELRDLEARNHYKTPIDSTIPAGPRQAHVLDALAIMRESAQTARNAAVLKAGWVGAAKRYTFDGPGKGLAGKGMLLGGALPLGMNVASRLGSHFFGSNGNQ